MFENIANGNFHSIKWNKAPFRAAVEMYLAAACRPDALCTWTTSVTTREAAPLPVWPPGLTGRFLYRMHTSRKPEKQNRLATTYKILLSLLWVSVYLRAEADALWDRLPWESGAGRTAEPLEDAVSAWWPLHTVWTMEAFLWPQAGLERLGNNIYRHTILYMKPVNIKPY